MDLIIKNIEQLKYFQDKMNPKTITIDVEKMIEGHEDFYDIFKKSCKVYKHEEPEKLCRDCKYFEKIDNEEPCKSCWRSSGNRPNWEAAEPTRIEHNDYINKVLDRFVEIGESYPVPTKDLKEVTERMQGEFDATGKDVAYFMNHRIKKEVIK